MEIFKEYAPFYDLMYHDKNYAAEVDFVSALIKNYSPHAKTILDGGCGTGGHSILLAQKGFDVLGVDLSPDMIKLAEQKKYVLKSDRVNFQVADLATLKTTQQFDAVLLLFHVFCYLPEPLVDKVLANISSILSPGGILILDFWSENAVKAKPIEKRTKVVSDSDYKVYRITETSFDYKNDLAQVDFTFFVENMQTKILKKFEESHTMGFYSPKNMQRILVKHGFEIALCREWLTNKEPTQDTFSLYVAAHKKHGN